MAEAAESSERLEDVFEEVIRKFRSPEEFFRFAQSKVGLKLDQRDIAAICEDSQCSIGQQKLEALNIWSRNQGPAASPALIREKVDKYFEPRTESDSMAINMDEPQQTQVPTEIKTETSSDCPRMKFRGKVEADTVIGHVDNLDIGMPRIGNENDNSQPFKMEDKLSYEQQTQNRDESLRRKDENLGRGRGNKNNSSQKSRSMNLEFHSDVQAKNIIGSAVNVRIGLEQRPRKKPQNEKEAAIEKVVVAEQEGGERTTETNPGSAEGVAVENSEQPVPDVEAKPFSAESEANPGSAESVAVEHSDQPVPDVEPKLFSPQSEERPEIPGAEQYSKQPAVNGKAVPIWDDQNGGGASGEQPGRGAVPEGSQSHHGWRRDGDATGGQQRRSTLNGLRHRERPDQMEEDPLNPAPAPLNPAHPLNPAPVQLHQRQEQGYDNLHLFLALCLTLCLLCLANVWYNG